MESSTKGQLRGSLLLLITAIIWGSAFVAQSTGMDHVDPFTFNFTRTVVGVLALLIAIPFLDKLGLSAAPETKDEWKKLWISGSICGVIMFGASASQQIGIVETSPGKAGFITALYIVIVPVLGVFMKKRVSILTWIAVVIAIVGMYLLCAEGEFKLGAGDSMVMLSALLFALHIITVDKVAPAVDCVRLSCVQFFVSAVLAGLCMLVFETPTVESVWNAKYSILYAGVMSTGVAYTMQIIGQSTVEPTVASLLMSLESVFAALTGWLILRDIMTGYEIVGCLLIFIAVIIAQLKFDKIKTNKNSLPS